jgi:UDP-glucose 4-epimerase
MVQEPIPYQARSIFVSGPMPAAQVRRIDVRLLVTGGTGFVMSVLGRHWLDADPAATLVVLDAAPLDATAARYFAPVAERLTVLVADVTRPDSWRDALSAGDITHIVHGATVTPSSRGMALEVKREPESDNPARITEVNVMGTVAMLEWARAVPRLERFIYVSSGAVYKHHGPDRPGEPLPEDGYVMPRALYGISKLASELITERYGKLFGLSTVSVRPSSVYGTLDRATATRNLRHVPNRLAHMALDGARRVRVNTQDAVGDYIHAEDVAAGIVSLLHLPSLRYSAYNLAIGATASIRDMVGWIAEKIPGFNAEITSPEEADILQDASLNSGMWGAYDISRIKAETGWTPRPVREALHAYMDWIAAERRSESESLGARA